MKNKLSKLLEGDLKIVQKRKIWFLVPAIVAVLTAIMLLIYTFATTCTVNLSADLAGGYSVTIKLTALNADSYDDYVQKIEDVAQNLTDENGDEYGLKIAEFRRIGAFDAESAVRLSYHGIKGLSSEEMDELNERFVDELNVLITHVRPTVSISGSHATIIYDRTMAAYQTNIELAISELAQSATFNWLNATPAQPQEGINYFTQLRIGNFGTVTADQIAEAATVVDEFRGSVGDAESLSGSTNKYVIHYGLSALAVVVVAFVLYALLRFRSFSIALTMGLSLVLSLLLTFMLVCIFYVPITLAFMGAMVATACVSLFGLMLVFDRIKENNKNRTQEESQTVIINKSIKQSIVRMIMCLAIPFIMALVTVIACLIAGSSVFASLGLVMLIGVIASAFTTMFFAPSLWSLLGKNSKSKTKDKPKTKKQPTTI